MCAWETRGPWDVAPVGVLGLVYRIRPAISAVDARRSHIEELNAGDRVEPGRDVLYVSLSRRLHFC